MSEVYQLRDTFLAYNSVIKCFKISMAELNNECLIPGYCWNKYIVMLVSNKTE